MSNFKCQISNKNTKPLETCLPTGKIGNWKLEIRNFQQGFTLIELLIVISIIGILATLLMVNFIGVRQRGRDAQRKSNIRQIQAALELYRSDQSNYPSSGNRSQLSVCGQGHSLIDPNNGSTVYMQTIPCDPLGGPYLYQQTSSTTYILVACLENTSDSDGTTIPNGFTAGTCPNTNEYYAVTNP